MKELIQTATQLLEERNRHENFKKWFGKSMLTHDDGTPMVFYHGTDKDFKEFSHAHVGKGNDQYGSGFYFTNNPDTASMYASMKDSPDQPNVIKAHLKLENPISPDDETPLKREHIKKLIMAAPELDDALSNFGDVEYEGKQKVLNRAVEGYADHKKFNAMNYINNDFYNGHEGTFLKNFTEITKHDGVIQHNDNGQMIVNVFHPHQIKSAVGNNGNYSQKSNVITEARQIDWMQVTKSESKKPLDHIRDVVDDHAKMGWVVRKTDEHPATNRPMIMNRGGGCQRSFHLYNDKDDRRTIHMKFSRGQGSTQKTYKIAVEDHINQHELRKK